MRQHSTRDVRHLLPSNEAGHSRSEHVDQPMVVRQRHASVPPTTSMHLEKTAMTQTFPSDCDEPQNAPPSANNLAALILGDLAQLCTQELHRLLASRLQPDDFNDAFALELFRRAAGGNADAWTCIFQQYSLLVTTWLLQFAEAAPVIERRGATAIVDATFIQLSQALTPGRLRQLPDHRALLRYLKMTLGSVVLDARRTLFAPHALAAESGQPSTTHPFQKRGWQASATQALWQAILAELDSNDLRQLASLSFARAMSPEAISSQFSTRFPTVEDVYRGQRAILDRVRQSPGIQDLLSRLEQ